MAVPSPTRRPRLHRARLAALPLLVGVGVGVGACGGTTAATAPVARTAEREDEACPVAVPGTAIAVEDTTAGAALAFVTTGDRTEVQRRAEELARRHNERHAAMGELPTAGQPTPAHDHGAHHGAVAVGDASPVDGGSGAIAVHSRAIAAATADGARIDFVVAPADAAALREALEEVARRFAGGRCGAGR